MSWRSEPHRPEHPDEENARAALVLERDADTQARVDAALDAMNRDLPCFFPGAVSPVPFAAAVMADRQAQASERAWSDPIPPMGPGHGPGVGLTPPRRDHPPFEGVSAQPLPGGRAQTHDESESS